MNEPSLSIALVGGIVFAIVLGVIAWRSSRKRKGESMKRGTRRQPGVDEH